MNKARFDITLPAGRSYPEMKILFTILLLIYVDSIFPQSWHKSYQPEGMIINSIDVHPYDSTRILLTGYEGPFTDIVFYSSDMGESWKLICSTAWRATARFDMNTNYNYVSTYSKIIRSDNLGLSWDTVYSSPGYVDDIKQNPVKGDWFMTQNYNVFKSSDGNKWKLVLDPELDLFKINFSPLNGDIVVSTFSKGAVMSTDGGINWRILSADNEGIIFFDPYDTNILYTEYRDIENDQYLKKSADRGATWHIVHALPYNLLDCDGENGVTVFHAGSKQGIYNSTDIGISWQPVSPLINCYELIYKHNILYAAFPATGFAVHKDNNWEYRNSGILQFSLEDISVTPSYVFISTWNNIFRTKLPMGENEWVSLRPDSAFYNFKFYNDSLGFGCSNQNLYKTTDEGNTWFFVKYFGEGWEPHGSIDFIGPYIFYANWEGLHRVLLSDLQFNLRSPGKNHRVMYDGEFLYAFRNNNALYKSSDLGNNWNFVGYLSAGLEYHAFAVKDIPRGILVGGRGEDPIFGAGTMYFIKPDNEIINFAISASSIAAPRGREDFYVMLYKGSRVYKLDSLYGRLNGFEEGLPFVSEWQGGHSLHYLNVPGYQHIIYTSRGGIMEVNLSGTVVFSEDENTPLEFRLQQNYPNPFNPSTTISYSIPYTSFVSIKIYDVLGREAAKLIGEEKPSGIYEAVWTPDDLPSGIYFCRIEAGQFSDVKKMILIK